MKGLYFCDKNRELSIGRVGRIDSTAEAIKEFRDDRPNLRIHSPRGIQIKHIVSRTALTSLGINGDGTAIVRGDRHSIVLLLFGEPPFEPSQHS